MANFPNYLHKKNLFTRSNVVFFSFYKMTMTTTAMATTVMVMSVIVMTRMNIIPNIME